MKIIISTLLMLLLSPAFYAKGLVEVINKGIPGNNSAQLLARLQEDVLSEKPDLVIILVGTNDLLNTQKMITVDSFYINMERITETLRSNNIQTVLVSPPTVDSVYLFQRHDPALFDISPSEKLLSVGETMKQICKEKGLLFIDLFSYLKQLNIPQHNTDDIIRNLTNSDSADGTHFTKKGNQLLATFIYDQLKKRCNLSSIRKIVCFGDSITYSVYMEGAGTSQGDTYPAILQQLINN